MSATFQRTNYFGYFVAMMLAGSVIIFITYVLIYSGDVDYHSSLSEFPSCHKPVSNVVFLDAAECESSAIMRIMSRFAKSHSLNPVFKPKFSFYFRNVGLSEAFLIQPPGNKTYNIFVSYLDFIENNETVEIHLPKNTVYLGIVKEPLNRFASHLAFFRWYDKARDHIEIFYGTKGWELTDEEILVNVIKGEYTGIEIPINYMSDYYGFRNAYYNHSETEIFIENAFKKFKYIMIAEYFDESLVLLKRYMCWELKDVLYISQVHINNYPGDLDITINAVIAKWFMRQNVADIRFYSASLYEFWRKVVAEGDGFVREVSAFKRTLKKVRYFCSGKLRRKNLLIERSEWTEPFVVNKNYCHLLRMRAKETMGFTASHFLETPQLA